MERLLKGLYFFNQKSGVFGRCLPTLSSYTGKYKGGETYAYQGFEGCSREINRDVY